MNKLTTIIILLITVLLFFLILFQNNIIKKEAKEDLGVNESSAFDCLYIEKNIGDRHEGGILAYCDKDGKNGLVVPPSDQATSIAWGCNGTYINNIFKEYGYGKGNTENIIRDCSDRPTAASICYNLTIDRYNDWFLPSQDELNHLYINRNKIGEFNNAYYWSSTETNFISAIRQSFNLGVQNSSGKSGTYRVRCARYF